MYTIVGSIIAIIILMCIHKFPESDPLAITPITYEKGELKIILQIRRGRFRHTYT